MLFQSNVKSALRVTRICLQSARTLTGAKSAPEIFPHFPFKRPHGAEPPLEFAKLRKDCPVSKVSIVDDKSWAWLLTKHADIRKVLCDNEHFSKIRTRPNFPELTEGGRLAAFANKATFVDMDPPEHTCQRNMVAPTFTPSNVKTMGFMIQGIIDKQIKEMKAATTPSVDLVASFSLPVASNVMYRILGIPTKDMAFLAKCNAVRTNGSATAAQASAANQELVDYLKQLIEAKAKHPTEDDLINTLIREQLQASKIALDDLVQVVFLMLVAGNATMATMIALGVSTFLQHPKQLAEMQANPLLYKNAVVELCRFHTASALATRKFEKCVSWCYCVWCTCFSSHEQSSCIYIYIYTLCTSI